MKKTIKLSPQIFLYNCYRLKPREIGLYSILLMLSANGPFAPDLDRLKSYCGMRRDHLERLISRLKVLGLVIDRNDGRIIVVTGRVS